MELIDKHLKRLVQRIASYLAKIPQPLTSIPGIGPVLAADISEIGTISRFAGQEKLATWRKHQSGGFTGDITPMTKTGNPYLRYYLIQAAQCLVMHNQEYREYYARKVKETPRHSKKRALSLTARKLVRLVYALLSKGVLYRAQDTKPCQAASQEVNSKPAAQGSWGTKATQTKAKTKRLPHTPKSSARLQEHARAVNA